MQTRTAKCFRPIVRSMCSFQSSKQEVSLVIKHVSLSGQTTVSDLLVRFPAQALRIHTRELGGVVLGERTAPAPPIPKQTPGSRVTALHPDLGSLAAANSREACIPGHR